VEQLRDCVAGGIDPEFIPKAQVESWSILAMAASIKLAPSLTRRRAPMLRALICLSDARPVLAAAERHPPALLATEFLTQRQ